MAHPLLVPPPMRLALSIALAVASGAASGQTTSGLTLQIQGTDQLVVGPSQCGNSVPVNWTVSSSFQICSSLRIWVTQGTSCATAPSASDFSLPEVTATDLQAGQGTRTLPLASLPGLTGADGGAGCGAAVKQEYRVCGTFKIAGGYPASCGSTQSDVNASSAPALTYDGQPPPVPTLTALVALDSSLVAKVGADSTGDTLTFILQVKKASDPDSAYVNADSFSADSSSGTITGLTNGVAYSVQAIAEDAAANQSLPSASLTGTPVATSGFFGEYTGAGGAEQGGCSISGGALWPAALALAFAGWFAISRRRHS